MITIVLPETAEGQVADTAIKNPTSYGENSNAQATADGDGKYFAKQEGATGTSTSYLHVARTRKGTCNM